MTKSAKNEGFTLVELLISLAVLSIMAIYAVQTFSTLRSMSRVEADIAAQIEVDTVARLLRTEISDIRAMFKSSNTQNPTLYFLGRNDSLAYVVAVNGEREIGGFHFVTLSLDRDGTLTSRRQLMSTSLNEHIDKIVLLRGVEKVGFSYFGSVHPLQSLTEWSTDNQLPRTISVNISFPKQDKRKNISLLVRLQTVD